MKRFLLLIVVVAASLAPTASAAVPDFVTFKHLGTTCTKVNGNIRVKTRYHMTSANSGYLTKWVTRFRLEIRLEKKTGLNLASNWHTAKYPPATKLPQDKNVWANLSAVSDNKSGDEDWIVHIKLIWERDTYPDIVQHLKFSTSRLNCPGSDQGAISVG